MAHSFWSWTDGQCFSKGKKTWTTSICSYVPLPCGTKQKALSSQAAVVYEEMCNVRDSSWCSSPKYQIKAVGISSREESYITGGPLLTPSTLLSAPPARPPCHEDGIMSPLPMRRTNQFVQTEAGKRGEPRLPCGWLSQQSPVTQPPMIRELVKSSTEDTSPNRHCSKLQTHPRLRRSSMLAKVYLGAAKEK